VSASPEPTDQPSAEERRAALAAVLRSATFERSARLRELLAYLGEHALSGDPAALNEYRIAVDVFKRGDDFFPGSDSIVRRQAHALRQKLQRCYETELSTAPVRLVIPPGNYAPLFVRAQAATPAATAKTIETPAPRARRWLPLAAAAVLLLALGWMGGRLGSHPRSSASPALSRLWAGWLEPEAPVTLCFSNPATADIGHGTISEAQAAVRLAAFLGRHGVAVRPTQSRFLNWDVMRTQPTILLGHGDSNPLIGDLLKDRPFTIERGTNPNARRIVVRQPGRKEPTHHPSHAPLAGEQVNEQFALVSFLPGLGKARGLLIVAGLGSQATDAAAEWLLDEGAVQILLDQLRAATGGRNGPYHFQAVLRTEVRQKVPTAATLVTWRLL
jgi:hypothetical protein